MNFPNVNLTLCCPEVHFISGTRRTCYIWGGNAIFVLLRPQRVTLNMHVLQKNISTAFHGMGTIGNRTSGDLLLGLKDRVLD